MTLSRPEKSHLVNGIKTLLALSCALAAAACVIAFFAILDVVLHGSDAKFCTLQNFQAIAFQNAFVIIASVGMLVVIIAGGIDLSAGVTLALCSTIIAWGMREDVGFLIAHGENVAGAARRLKSAGDELRTAQRRDDANHVKRLQIDVESRRKRLAELLQIKIEQMKPPISNAGDSDRISKVEKAISEIREPTGPIDLDPSLVGQLPNAAPSALLAVGMGVLAGLLCGLLNGLIIVLLRVVPFIGTLGTMMIYLGTAQIVADQTSVRPTAAQVPRWIDELGASSPDPSWLVVSKAVWLALLLAVIVACVLRYTVFGRYVFALGSNESTARLCGVNVPLTKVAVYVLAGTLVGVAAICFFAKTTTGEPTAGTGWELKFIAAVVIGGASLNGGRGTVLGALTGTVIMGAIGAGCGLIGMVNPLQNITLGVIIIAAVTVDQLRQRKE